MIENKMDKSARWEKIRPLGRSHFIWKYGVLRFGIPMAAAMSLFSVIGQPNAILGKLVIAVMFCLAGGYAFGVASWQVSEMQYLRASTQEAPHSNKELALAALRKTWWFLALPVFFAIGFGPSYEYANYLMFRHELSKARAQWDANAPAHYQVRVRGHHFFVDDAAWECYLHRPTIVFENGQAVDGDNWDTCEPIFAEMSIEGMFKQVEQELSGMNVFMAKWEIEFDQDRGYITRYYVRCSGSLLLPDDHCLESLSVQNHGFKSIGFEAFEVLE